MSNASLAELRGKIQNASSLPTEEQGKELLKIYLAEIEGIVSCFMKETSDEVLESLIKAMEEDKRSKTYDLMSLANKQRSLRARIKKFSSGLKDIDI